MSAFNYRLCGGLLLALLLCASPRAALFAANVIDPARGVDRQVDYAALGRIGPWDDRNYELSAADVALLSPDELSARDPVPAFFRVELRRGNPELPKSGKSQYPRSALQRFERKYLGYLINGRIYRDLRVADDGSRLGETAGT